MFTVAVTRQKPKEALLYFQTIAFQNHFELKLLFNIACRMTIGLKIDSIFNLIQNIIFFYRTPTSVNWDGLVSGASTPQIKFMIHLAIHP